MAALSEWLQIMLGEIARKREDQERARAEESQRATEARGATESQHASEAQRSVDPRSGSSASSSAPELRIVARR